MDRFDYKVSGIERYVSSGLTPGNLQKPVAWGSKSSFIESISEELIEGDSVQFIAEPIQDDVEVVRLAGVKVKYLYNGVYLVTAVSSGAYSSDYTSEYPEPNPSLRVAANTGPVAIKLTNLTDDIQVVIDGIPVSYQKGSQSDNTLIVSENVAYDKFIVNYDGDLNELVDKTPRSSVSDSGMLRPLSYDKLYEPKLITAEEMFSVDDYYVTSRKLSNANTSVEFYSDLNQIQKSDDGEEWLPVQKIEYHGDDATIFRSKDKQFALRFYDTTIKEFVILGAVTAVEGEIYKNGDNIGSYFSHDCYKIQNGSLTISSEGMNSVTILGYLEDIVAPNVLSNGSFDSEFSGWSNVTANISIDPEAGRLSGPAVKMTSGGIGLSTSRIPVTPGETWRWEVWYKTSPDFAGSLGMRPLRWEPGSNVPGHVNMSKNEGWTKISFDWQVADGCSEVNMRFANSITAGSVWIDDVRLSNITDNAEGKSVQVDNSGPRSGKMHLYTFQSDSQLTLTGNEIYLAAIGVNLNHQDTMDHITGRSQISYADEIHSLEDGQSMNGENEYSILDLQWNV